MPALGQHLIADFYDCDVQKLCNCADIEAILVAAAQAANANILAQYFHHFGEGQGVTGVLLLKESHMSIHTWPEHKQLTLDLFLCGEVHLQAALDVLTKFFKPQHIQKQIILRGEIKISEK